MLAENKANKFILIFLKFVLEILKASAFLRPLMTEETKPKSQSKTPDQMDFYDSDYLSRFVTDTGKILPRRITGLTAKYQRRITKSIKRARAMLTMK